MIVNPAIDIKYLLSPENSFTKTIKKDYDDISIIKPPAYYFIYDYFVYRLKNIPHKPANRLIHTLCKRFNLKGKNILDVGSFTGYYSFYFRCERNNVTGVELSNKNQYAINRFAKYDIPFIQANILEYFENISNGQFDFIFCSNFPAHYDTGNVYSSDFMASFVQTAISKLSNKGILYYLFYSEKHSKVKHPVNENDMENFLRKNKISNYQISQIRPIDHKMLEVVIRPGLI